MLQLSLLLLSTLLVADFLAHLKFLILLASLLVLTANDFVPAVAGFSTVETSRLLPASLLLLLLASLLFLASLLMLVFLLLLASLLLLLTYLHTDSWIF